MKTLIITVCLFGSFLMQGCIAYAEPVGGYYQRDSFWYYKDNHGMERREHGRYHHPVEQHHEEGRK